MVEKFEQKPLGEYDPFKKEGELWTPKEERGRIRSAEEVEKARESIPEEKKVESKEEKEKKAEERRKTFAKGGTRSKERNEEIERELAREKEGKSRQEEIERIEQELKKEAEKEKPKEPKETFEDVTKRLEEELKKVGPGGEELSEAERLERTRNFYLDKLGYKLETKGLLRGKTRVWDRNEKRYLTDENDKIREFKAFFKLKEGRTPLIDFLRGELKDKIEKGQETKETAKAPEFKRNAGWWRDKLSAEGFLKYIPDKDLKRPMSGKEAREYFFRRNRKDKIAIPKGMDKKEFFAGIEEKLDELEKTNKEK